MIRYIALLIALLASSLLAQTTPPTGLYHKTPELKAFTHARIITAPGKVLEDGTLIIDQGRIIALGTDLTLPDGALEIDLHGKSIYPGFIDPYTEYGLITDPHDPAENGRKPVYEAERVGGNACNSAVHAETNWGQRFAPDPKGRKPWLKLGFTSVQSIHCDGIFQGRACVVSLGAGLPNDLLIRPYGWHFGSLRKGRSPQEYPASMMGSIALIRQTLHDVEWYGRAHAAFEKDRTQKMPEFNSAIEALATVPEEKIIFRTRDLLTLLRVDRLAREFDLDVVIYGSGDEYQRVRDVKSTGRTIIIPVTFPEIPNVMSLDDDIDIQLSELRHWEQAPANAAALQDNNITFAFTSHGLKKQEDFLKQVRKAVRFGLGRVAALAALTKVPADICGIGHEAGTLETGKRADFFICDGDIFDDSTRIFSTWTAGQKTEFMPLDAVELSGSYTVTLGEHEFTLALKDHIAPDKRSIKGKLETEAGSATIRHASISENKLTFAVELDTFGIDGISRFSGRLVDGTIDGWATLGDGQRLEFTAARSGDISPTDSVDSEVAPESEITSVARLTFPFTAFANGGLPPSNAVLIKNATVWTSEEEGILAETDILVVDGKFAAIGSNLPESNGCIVVDASGKHVTPGIIDAHSHIAISGAVNEGTEAVTSEVRIGDIVNPTQISIYRSLAGGTTMAHLLHGSANPIGGQSQLIKLRWGGTAEELKVDQWPPTIKFALGENVKQSNWGEKFSSRYPQSRMGVETIIKDAFQTAREYEGTWTKYRGLSKKEQARTIPPRRDLRLDALVEILNDRLFVHCHSYRQAEVLMLMRLAEEFDFRISSFQHILEGYKVADEMAAHGATASTFADWWAYKFEVYDAIPQNPCLMQERGVLVSINSDSQDLQRRLNQEAAKSVMYCGMSEADALNLVTINPARQLKVDQWVGSIKIGKDADFVIWDGPPLSIMSRAEKTYIDGRCFFDIELDLVARAADEQERNLLIQKALMAKEKVDLTVEKKKHDQTKQSDISRRES